MNYKDTLNLPRTDFPMKGNLARKEPEIQSYWEEIGLYRLILEKGEGRSTFILHDGPPYANGAIHVGTAYNKILKDIIIKYKTMAGQRCPYVPGWDCHGLPIEHEVSKQCGPDSALDRIAFRKRCRDYAMEFVGVQCEQFRRLGVLGDFEDPYLTLAPEYEATNIEVFAEFFKKGLVYRGRKPVHWCTTCVTALAEAEIEYDEEESPSIFVRFPLKDRFQPAIQSGKPASFLIWTTTPWTLPANVAIALHPSLAYAAVETADVVLLMAEPLVEGVMEELALTDYRMLETFRGSEAEGLKCSHPWFDRDSVVVLAEYVTLEHGTGCVHTAPGHGQDDYLTGQEYDLPSPMPVDDHGFFTEEAGPFAGMELEEANGRIIEDLKERGLLMKSGTVVHQYPHCWRCKNPVVFRATPQWFIALDRSAGNGTLRREALEAIQSVEWIPDWTINRIGSMVENRPDWCISRQRAWGVPLPILYCDACGEVLVTVETLEAIRELIGREGADSWFVREPREFLPEGTRCASCGGSDFRKENDIIDVWFESGISHLAVLRGRTELQWPADLYLEGSDQHRGWFQSSLLVSVGFEGEPPYGMVLTHGFTVTGEGKKMSKSLGNAIDPRDVYDRSGADILRLWTATTDYAGDMPVSEEILSRVTEAYRRVRNTLRFLIGNTFDFEPSQHAVDYPEMEEIDRWMLSVTQGLIGKVTGLIERYLFHQAVQALHLFCTVELSSLYLDILKDRLYTFPVGSRERRSAQTAMSIMLDVLTTMVAPVLSHTAEEAHMAARRDGGERSVHLKDWPVVDPALVDEELEARWGRLLEIRETVYASIEEARQAGLVGSGLEAKVRISARGRDLELLEGMKTQLPTIFIVSQVDVGGIETGEEPTEPGAGVSVEVERAEGEKCQRCWNYRASVGISSQYPDICERCLRTLEAIGR